MATPFIDNCMKTLGCIKMLKPCTVPRSSLKNNPDKEYFIKLLITGSFARPVIGDVEIFRFEQFQNASCQSAAPMLKSSTVKRNIELVTGKFYDGKILQ